MVRIGVAETGKGVTSEFLERLFQAFVSTKENGMGVGLPISRRIVESRSGLIWAEANPAGITFYFTVESEGPG
jgi:two-component system, LuxR family, sensor kinase FixL